MVIQVDTNRLNPYKLREVVKCLRKGGVIIYPTDTVYAMGCDLHNTKAIDKLCQIKGIKSNKSEFSFICNSIKQISHYTKQLDNSVFKVIKKALPGPYTFILEANSNVPKLVKTKKKTVGVRIPNHPVTQHLVEELGNPIITTSIKSRDEIAVYMTDPHEIADRYLSVVDCIITAEPSSNKGSTVINCASEIPELIREGIGDPNIL